MFEDIQTQNEVIAGGQLNFQDVPLYEFYL